MTKEIAIEEQELLDAVRANLAEAAKDKDATDKDEDTAVQVKNPLDPEATEKKEETVAEEKTTDPVIETPVVEAATTEAPKLIVIEHLADGSGVQAHSAGGLYPWVIYAQEKEGGKQFGVISPMDQEGKLHGTYDQAVTAAQAEKTAHGEKFKASMAKVEESVVDIKEILSGNDQLSEEFKEKAAIIFNTAVKMQVDAISSKLEEQYTNKSAELDAKHEAAAKDLQEKFETQLSEAVAKFEENLSEKIDGYFGALSEEWMKENELALEGGIQAELVESFIGGMRTLFEQHYVDMPEEKRDLLSEANAKAADLEAQLAARIAEATEAAAKVAALQREKIISESAHGMTELDASRFRTLMEDFEFDTEESFTKKATTVKESFFKTKAALNESKTTKVETPVVAPTQTATIVEEKVIPVIDTPSKTTPMDMYVKAARGAA
jgi:hypothetical protein